MVSTKNDQPKDSETHKPKKIDGIKNTIKEFEECLDKEEMNAERYSDFVCKFSDYDKSGLDYYIFQYSNQKDGNELTPILILTISTAITVVLKTSSIIDIPSIIFIIFIFGIIIWSMTEIRRNNIKKQIRAQVAYVLKEATKYEDKKDKKDK